MIKTSNTLMSDKITDTQITEESVITYDSLINVAEKKNCLRLWVCSNYHLTSHNISRNLTFILQSCIKATIAIGLFNYALSFEKKERKKQA